MLSDCSQSLFIRHEIRIRCRIASEKSASEKRNATSLRLEREEEKSHSTTFEEKKESHSTTLERRKERSHSTTLSSSIRKHNE
jgi:hypothetical protein